MAWEGKGKTAVVGLGMSKLTRRADKPLGALALDACYAAIADAGLKPSDIDGLATYPDQPFRGAGNRDGEDLVNALFLMTHGEFAPDIKWYAQISTGMIASAPIEGVNALMSGACNYVLFWRAMHIPKGTYNSFRGYQAGGDGQFGAPYGHVHGYQTHAMAYRHYLNKYNHNREKMAALVTNSRKNANLNPNAFFYEQPMSVEDYLNARTIADPLALFDCDVPVEGCTALVMTTADRAKDLKNKPAYIAGYGQNTAHRPEYMTYMIDDYLAAGRPHAVAVVRPGLRAHALFEPLAETLLRFQSPRPAAAHGPDRRRSRIGGMHDGDAAGPRRRRPLGRGLLSALRGSRPLHAVSQARLADPVRAGGPGGASSRHVRPIPTNLRRVAQAQGHDPLLPKALSPPVPARADGPGDRRCVAQVCGVRLPPRHAAAAGRSGAVRWCNTAATCRREAAGRLRPSVVVITGW